MRAVILLAFVSIVSGLPTNGDTRLIGGIPTTIEQFPFMASLQALHDGIFPEHVCGGTLLTSVTVLTAGSCFVLESNGNNSSTVEWQVRLGSSSTSGGGSVHSILYVTMHPDIDYTTRNNDLALIRLATAAVLSSSIRAARIAGTNYNLSDGTPLQGAGWGIRFRSHSDNLLRMDLNIVNQERCVESYAANSTAAWEVTDNSICATSGICVGDYGGPIVHQGDVVVGVMSFAYNCGAYNFPSVSTRVSRYSDWIVANA